MTEAEAVFEIKPISIESGGGGQSLPPSKVKQAAPGRDGKSVLQGHPAVAIIDYARTILDNIVAMVSHGG
jgi:hypothetical protein